MANTRQILTKLLTVLAVVLLSSGCGEQKHVPVRYFICFQAKMPDGTPVTASTVYAFNRNIESMAEVEEISRDLMKTYTNLAGPAVITGLTRLTP